MEERFSVFLILLTFLTGSICLGEDLPNNVEIVRTDEADSVRITQRNWPGNSVQSIKSYFETGFTAITFHAFEGKLMSLTVHGLWTDVEGYPVFLNVNLQYEGAGDWSIQIPQFSRGSIPNSTKMWKDQSSDDSTSTVPKIR